MGVFGPTIRLLTWECVWDLEAGLEIMVYLGILVTRKFWAHRKFWLNLSLFCCKLEITTSVLSKMLCPRICLRISFYFSVKISVFYLSLYMWCTENL